MIYLYYCSTIMHSHPITRFFYHQLIISTKRALFILIYILLLLSMNVAAAPEDDQILHLLGLPRYQHCSFALNNSFYIFGGEYPSTTILPPPLDGFRLNFTSVDMPPTMDDLFSSVTNQTSNTTTTTASSLLNDIALGAGCAVTSYGHALFLPPAGTLLAFNLLTHQWIIPDNVQGSPSALAAFSNETLTSPPSGTTTTTTTTTSRRLEGMVSAMWNDMWIIFGGRLAGDEGNNNNFTQDTFILDARMPTPWVWFESPMTLYTPPIPSVVSRGTMVATSRWVLYFAITLSNNNNATATAPSPIAASPPLLDNSNTIRPYDIAVHCFDPYVLLWVGQIANFTSATDQLKATSFALDSVLVVPAYATNISTSTFTNNTSTSSSGVRQSIIVPSQGLWRLDMSQDTPTGTIHWIGNAGPFRPVLGGTTTRLAEDLIVLYGGVPFSHNSLRFWNTTSNAFVDPQWWRETQWNTGPTSTPTFGPTGDQDNGEGGPNVLAIVLGTVLSILGLMLLLAIIYYFCCYRKRRRNHSTSSSAGSRSITRGRRSMTPISIQTDFRLNNNNDTLIAGRPYSPPPSNNNNNNNEHQEENMNNMGSRRMMESPEEDAKTWATHLRRTLSAVARKNRIRWSRSSQTPPPTAAVHQDMTQASSPSGRPMMLSPLEEGVLSYHDNDDDPGPTHHENPPDSPIVVIDMERQRRIRASSRFNEHFDLLVPPESTILSQAPEEGDPGESR
ncbi:hypothetical protein BDA99DRAFT_504580 [Phascolomyces articulosus]|uniref:Galactose oxidase n=1 Tax=Phascolomyces articulosus TaxID=60185 RepID=A0AAD5PFL7_9FUNG|nr:hypothetical protein BDA99DRAFT_504580 [Phascolomyces articulosus]